MHSDGVDEDAANDNDNDVDNEETCNNEEGTDNEQPDENVGGDANARFKECCIPWNILKLVIGWILL